MPMKNQMKQSPHTAMEQCRAVLSVWTEQRSVETVCRELGIQRHALIQWQERAMVGMIGALSPREAQEERKPALAVAVRRLVERMAAEQDGQPPRLARRLASVAEARTTAVAAMPAAR
jgi:transposase-like protein